MQSSSPKIIFLKNNKIPVQYDINTLHGQVRFIDVDNYVHICTTFDRGVYIGSQVFFKKHRRLKNMGLEIDEERVVWFYGREVEEFNFDQVIAYNGGYLGYYRHGLGSQYKQKQTKNAIERGIWQKDKKQGKFILKNIITQLPIDKFKLIQKRCPKKKAFLSRLKTNNKPESNEKAVKILLKAQQIDQKLFQMRQQEAHLQELGQIQIKEKYLQQFLKLSMDMNYNDDVLIDKKEGGMMSEAMCQVYLDYLSHQQHYQKPYTLIINLYISDLIHKSQTNGQCYKDLKLKISNYMKRYRNSYNIWKGLWKRLILPLSINKHFSFIMMTFNIQQKHIKCCVYDSTSSNNKQSIYENIMKQFLIIELQCFITGLLVRKQYDQEEVEKISRSYRQMIEGLSLERGNFPRQKGDNQSCGVFMLCGIADLMKLNKVNFKEEQIYNRRANILKTLRDILFYFKQSA